MFLSVARGKVAEGIDFDRHYGRCVILFGIPYQYTLSHVLRARLNFMRDKHGIRDNDFLTFDAIRQSAQCMGRVIRSKTDYGVVILADSRYNRADKRNKFPPWILQFIRESSMNLSTDVAVQQMKQFLRYRLSYLIYRIYYILFVYAYVCSVVTIPLIPYFTYRVAGQPIEQAALHSILLNTEQVKALSTANHFIETAAISAAISAAVVPVAPAVAPAVVPHVSTASGVAVVDVSTPVNANVPSPGTPMDVPPPETTPDFLPPPTPDDILPPSSPWGGGEGGMDGIEAQTVGGMEVEGNGHNSLPKNAEV